MEVTMKKKLFPLILALVCAIACAFGLAACGGSNKIKLSTAKFTDNGIDQINIAGIPNGTSTSEDYDGVITRQSGCIYYHDGGDDYVAEWDKGKWDACVEVRINNYYTVNTLKIEIGGKEYDLTVPDAFDKVILKNFYGFEAFDGSYYAYLEEPISSDTVIKLKGSTEIKTYPINIALENYDDYKDMQECQALRFTMWVGERAMGELEPTNYQPFEHNSKTEFTVTELIDAIESKQYTYYEVVKVIVNNFPAEIPSGNVPSVFKNTYDWKQGDNGEIILFYDFNCVNHSMSFDFSEFAQWCN